MIIFASVGFKGLSKISQNLEDNMQWGRGGVYQIKF